MSERPSAEAEGTPATRHRGVAAWVVWLLTAASFATAYVLEVAHRPGVLGEPWEVVTAVLLLIGPTAGLLIARRHPGNAIGWILLAAGLVLGVQLAADVYGTLALRPGGTLPGGPLAAFVTQVGWLLAFLLGPLLFLLYPTGRPPTRRWRLVVWVVGVGAILNSANWFEPGLVPADDLGSTMPQVENPLGIEAGRTVLPVIGEISWLLLYATGLAALVSLVSRWRRSRGVERQQLKWLAYTAAMVVVSVPFMELLPSLFGVPADIAVAIHGLLLVIGIPAAVGVAILRHHLYDIDLIINRTLVYGLLTATLAGVYAVGVLVVGQMFTAEREPGLVVAATTLAVAAIFRPLRRRIQDLVDRRFNRRRYDAARTIEGFTARLRQQTDLSALTAELLTVVDQTMQPTRALLWLRPRDGPGAPADARRVAAPADPVDGRLPGP